MECKYDFITIKFLPNQPSKLKCKNDFIKIKFLTNQPSKVECKSHSGDRGGSLGSEFCVNLSESIEYIVTSIIWGGEGRGEIYGEWWWEIVRDR